jgi:ABC-type glutathione transport system ATPase component
LLQKVNIKDPQRVYRSFPHQLSGGQLQRIMIAQAITGRPRLIIADEPTTALDVTIQKEVLELLQQVQNELKAGLILISHDLAVIAEVADRIVVMQAGNVVEQGRTEDIFLHPKKGYTKGLIAARPPVSMKLSRLPEIEDFLRIEGSQEVKISAYQKEFLVSKSTIRKRLAKLRNAPPILVGKEISKHFRHGTWFRPGKVVANENIQLKLVQGEKLGIAGESGSGKTTLARILAKLTHLDHGSIFLHDLDFHLYSDRDYHKKVQIIFQDPYSSDECVSALDVSVQAKILNLLQHLSDHLAMSMIFISHDLAVLRFISDRLMIMHNGRVVEEGDVEDVFDQPKTRYTRKLLQSGVGSRKTMTKKQSYRIKLAVISTVLLISISSFVYMNIVEFSFVPNTAESIYVEEIDQENEDILPDVQLIKLLMNKAIEFVTYSIPG